VLGEIDRCMGDFPAYDIASEIHSQQCLLSKKALNSAL
jgi:hypothetical protein